MKFTSKAGVNQRVRLGMQSEHIGIDYPASQIDYLTRELHCPHNETLAKK